MTIFMLIGYALRGKCLTFDINFSIIYIEEKRDRIKYYERDMCDKMEITNQIEKIGGIKCQKA